MSAIDREKFAPALAIGTRSVLRAGAPAVIPDIVVSGQDSVCINPPVEDGFDPLRSNLPVNALISIPIVCISYKIKL